MRQRRSESNAMHCRSSPAADCSLFVIMSFWHFLWLTPGAKDGLPPPTPEARGQDPTGRATLGHLANVGESGRLLFYFVDYPEVC